MGLSLARLYMFNKALTLNLNPTPLDGIVDSAHTTRKTGHVEPHQIESLTRQANGQGTVRTSRGVGWSKLRISSGRSREPQDKAEDV